MNMKKNKEIMLKLKTVPNTRYVNSILLFSIFLFSIVINVSLINNDSVWCDEAYTMILCRGDFSTLIENVKVDAWPPFYSMAAWLFAQLFGATVPVLKFFSVIPFILTMLLGITTIYKEFKSLFISMIFILMLGIMPLSMHMNIEIRGYSWGMFFVTLCGILAYKYYIYGHKWHTFIGMVLASLLAAYTHYFALMAVAIIYIFLFVALVIRNVKNLAICLAITLICFCAYLPWLNNFFDAATSVASGYWIEPIRFSKFAEYFLYPFTNYFDNYGNVEVSGFSFIFAVICVFLIFHLFQNIKGQGIKNSRMEISALLCLGVWSGVIVSGYIVSRLISPMFVARYMYFAVGLLWLFWAISVYVCIKNKKVLMLISALIVTTGIYGYAGQRKAEYENGTEIAKAAIMEHYENNIGIFSDSDYLNWTVIKYYFPNTIHAENGGNIDVITDKGERETFLFLCTDDFSEYYNAFNHQGYKIEDLGSYNIDGSYEFELYKMTKDVMGMSLILDTVDSQRQQVDDLYVKINLNGETFKGKFFGKIDERYLTGKGRIQLVWNKQRIKEISGKFKEGKLSGKVKLTYFNGDTQTVNVEKGYFNGTSDIFYEAGGYAHFTYDRGIPVGKKTVFNDDGDIIGQDWFYDGELLSELIDEASELSYDEYFRYNSKIVGDVVCLKGVIEDIFFDSEFCTLKLDSEAGGYLYIKYRTGRYDRKYSTMVPELSEGEEVQVYGIYNGIKTNGYILEEGEDGYSYPEITAFYIEGEQKKINIFAYPPSSYNYEEICDNPYYYTYMPISMEGNIEGVNVKKETEELYCLFTSKEDGRKYYLIIGMDDWKEWNLRIDTLVSLDGGIIGIYNATEENAGYGVGEELKSYPLIKIIDRDDKE